MGKNEPPQIGKYYVTDDGDVVKVIAEICRPQQGLEAVYSCQTPIEQQTFKSTSELIAKVGTTGGFINGQFITYPLLDFREK